jgi:anti-sigma factor RsiW
MTTCRELIEFLMGYLDAELPPEQRAAFDAHLRVCPPCRAYVDTYAEAIRLGKAAGVGELPATPPESLIRAILDARRRQGREHSPPA